MGGYAEQVPGIGMGGLGGNDLAVDAFGLRQLAALMMGESDGQCFDKRGHVCSHSAAAFSNSAAAIARNTDSQSPKAVCRNNRSVGYQGLSRRAVSQRQSGESRTATHAGTPRAPARWATALSDAMTRSSVFMIAAVSRKAPPERSISLDKSTMGNAP